MKIQKNVPEGWRSRALAAWLIASMVIVSWLLFGGYVNAASPFNLFEKKSIMYKNIVVEVGESGNDFAKKYQGMIDVNDRNPGSHFYRVNWSVDPLGTATVKNGSSTFEMGTVLSILGDSDDTYPAEGISDFSINLGLPPRNNILHDDARLKFYALLQRIQQAGWKRWIAPGMPRLNGADALRYQMGGVENVASLMSLDPSYIPSLEVWMTMKDMSGWQFYLNNIYMSVQFTRDRKRMDPNLPGAYFLTLKLQSKESFQRSELAYENRQRWKELYPDVRKRQAEKRLHSEEYVRNLGFKVDMEYRNPDD
ncbi:hypothetical protein [Collimonas humicola]|uniref:hypothetical protein n=1 Tax=Collimonas humicola TaxID=2825886 RepID=UPI001B8BC9AA|nr:hypothetical protein [Collimonas humicola]